MSKETLRVFLDTNVCYDILSRREPFYVHSAKALSQILEKGYKVVISALTVVNLHYFLRKDFGDAEARKMVISFKSFCEVEQVNNNLLDRSFASNMPDFEDALRHFIALESKCDLIFSRDKRGFKKSTIPVYSPEEYLENL